MRTTLRIDDDLMMLLKQRAHQDGIPMTELINRLIRRGLTNSRSGSRQTIKTYREQTFSMGQPAANLDKALALAAALEDQEVLDKLARRK